jgi:predicted transporter
MLYKSLILGVLFSIGIFAVKSGVGIAYVMARQQRARLKAAAVILFAVAYGLVFGLAALMLHRLDPVRNLTAIQTFIQSGMLVHLVMAGLMMIWGVILLKQTPGLPSGSRGWMILVLPCPVCATVIVFATAFCLSCFPDHFLLVVSSLYLAFLSISLLTMAVAQGYQRRMAQSSEAFLGGAMLLIATYFIVSVTVMPQFADLDKVYRMAGYHAKTQPQDTLAVALVLLLVAATFTVGYGTTIKKIRCKI